MPSIKSCLAAFALAALAISPVAQATPVQGEPAFFPSSCAPLSSTALTVIDLPASTPSRPHSQ